MSTIAVPARAQEGQGNPFANAVPGMATTSVQFTDFCSQGYPMVASRPGSDLAVAEDAMVVGLGNEALVQTANSLPVGFKDSTVAFAYEQSLNQHFAAGRAGCGMPAARPRHLASRLMASGRVA